MKKVGSKFIVVSEKGKNLMNYTKFPIGFEFKGLVIKGLTESDFKIWLIISTRWFSCSTCIDLANIMKMASPMRIKTTMITRVSVSISI